jgi:hypothetical protein
MERLAVVDRTKPNKRYVAGNLVYLEYLLRRGGR